VEGYSIEDALSFSNAMAALNCKELGAQGGIRDADAARDLIATGERRVNADFLVRAAAT